MANLIIVSGPQAVGKMTVAENLKEKFGLEVVTMPNALKGIKTQFSIEFFCYIM